MIGPFVAGAAGLVAVSLLGVAWARREGDLVIGETSERPDPGTEGAEVGLLLRGSSLPVTAVVGAAAGWFLAGAVGSFGGVLAGAAVPVGLRRRRTARRVRRLDEQLIDAVGAIASAVRSGRSLTQSIAIAAGEVDAPLGGLLDEATGRASLGVPLDEILDDLGRSIGGPDARLVTGVLLLHRRVGGTLAGSLDDLSRTLRSRRDGARELRSLTAQARLSAAILGLLPLGFFLFLSIVARSDVEAAYRSTAGATAIGLGLALQGAAFLWIRSLLRVDGP
jgi:tight adherence protein B